jgi:methyl-accepting chemotaxis protein/ligand-binding sensor domain-containing protein
MRRQQAWAAGLLWAVLSTLNAGAQDGRLHFARLTVENGLSQNFIRAILRDHKGFLWFGTENGLNRYDGYSIRVYQHDSKDSTSIANNRIACLFEDRDKRLWCGHVDGGISRFDRDHESFVGYSHDPKNSRSLSGNDVYAAFQDRKGDLWFGTSMGLDRLDETGGRFLHYGEGPGEQDGLKGNTVRGICEGLDGSLWIASIKGLFRLHPDRKKLDHFLRNPLRPEGLGLDELRSVVCDPAGLIWIGTYGGGLNVFNPATGVWNRYAYDPRKPDGIGYDVIQSLIVDNTRNVLFIGTENGGLNVMDLKTRRFEKYLPDLADPAGINSNSVWSLHLDIQGTLWIGTFNGGVNYASPYLQRFNVRTPRLGGLNNPFILSILEDRLGDLWIGTDGGGLNRLDGRTGRFTHYLNDPNDPSSLSGNAVLSVFEDRRGNLWMGTWAAGVNRLDRNTGRFTRYRNRFPDPDVFGTQNNALVTEDRFGNVIATTSMSVCVYDPSSDRFVPFEKKYRIDGLELDKMLFRVEDRNGFTWFGGWGGLKRVDVKGRRFSVFRPDPLKPNSLSSMNVFCGLEDSAGRLWFGTANGLDCFNPETQSFTVFTMEHGLPSNSIQGILEDGGGSLWISTARGIAKWADAARKPEEPRFRVFDSSDGLPCNEFKYGAAYKTRSGELFFGGQGGFVSFLPDRIRDNPVPPPVVLTGFSIFNRPVQAGAEGSPLIKPISETEAITLTHRQSVLTFEFSALSYILPQKNRYKYVLEGFEKDWNDVGTRRTASYTNLNPGRYTLRVTAANSDGVWNKEGTSIRLRVLPPFWKTLWFRGLMFLLAASAALTFYRWRVRSLHARREALEREVAERTAEVELKKEEIEQSYRRLTETAGALAVHTVQMNVAMTQIRDAMGAVNEGALSQNANVLQTRERINALAENIRQIAIEAKISDKASARTVETVGSGAEALESTLRGIEQVDLSVRETSKIVEELSASAARINDIVTFIDEMASHVNVLGLNAMIEASQAGGGSNRGFMVVAKEIRNLARETSKFTVEMSDFIHGIRKNILEVERVTKAGLETVGRSRKMTDQGKAALQDIRTSVEQEKERLSKITGHIGGMQRFSAEVAEAMNGVEAVSRRNRTTVEQVKTSTIEMQRQMEELAGLAKSLEINA